MKPDQLNRINLSALDRRITGYEREVLRNYAAALKKIRNDIAKLYERYSVNGQLTYAEMSKYNRLTSLESQVADIMRPAFGKIDRLIDKVGPLEYEEAFYRAGWAIDQTTGVALKWGLLNDKAVKAAVANPLDLIAKTRLKQDGITKIRRAVTQGLIRGQSYPNMMKEIRGAINGNAYDAMRIVRTEGQRAQVQGQLANYEQARKIGVEVVDIWDATLDSRTRESHGKLDGVKAHYKDGVPYWYTDVGEVTGPGTSGVASFDINCRCRIRGEIEGFAPEKRRIDGEIQKYQTYDEWKKKQGA
jgi:SPP1 gp7 family putative phage head morphogenesis protein